MEKELVDVSKKTGLVFAGNIGHNLINMLSTILFARLLGAEIYGNFVYVFMVFSLIGLFTQLGFSTSLVANIPKYKTLNQSGSSKKIIWFSFFVSSILCLIIVFVLILFNSQVSDKLLNRQDLSKVVIIMSPFLFSITFDHILHGIFRGLNKIKYHVLGVKILLPIIRIILFVILYLIGLKLLSIILATLIAKFVITTFLMLFLIRREKTLSRIFKNVEKGLYKNFLLYSLPLLLNGFVNYLIGHTDIYMIGYILTPTDVGVYRVALRIGYMSSFVLATFSTMFAPMISKLYHGGELVKIEQLYKVITRWVVAINLCAFSLILLLNKELLMIFGQEFVVGSSTLIIVAIGQVINSAVGSAGLINVMTGYPQYSLYINSFVAAVNIGLNFVLIRRAGITGAAIASLVSMVIANILRGWLVYRNHKIHPYNKDYLRVLLLTAVTFGVVFAEKQLVKTIWYIELAISIVLYVAIFGTGFWFFCLTDKDKIIVNAIKNRFSKKKRA